MICTNINNTKQNLYKLANACLKNNEVVKIETDQGNLILLKEEDYNNLVESLYLEGVKCVYNDVKEAVNTSTDNLFKGNPLK